MKKSIVREIVRMVLREQGGNMRSVDTTPNTWDSFEDFNISYYPQDDESCLLDIEFRGEKIAPMERHNNEQDAQHRARMIVDKYRVEVMNKSENV
tara:strand:- start:836 stop:1120 length:285 start_codon:yes stop_codon:yes gene_type:complete